MIKSIRGRLQWWYGAVYAVSIIVFGCLVYWRADRDANERATLQALSTAQYLDVSLRNVRPRDNRQPGQMNPPGEPRHDSFPPEFTFGPMPPEFQFRPGRDPDWNSPREPGPAGPMGRKGPPNPMPHINPVDSIRPPEVVSPERNEPRPPVDRMEFIVWRPDGSLLTRSEGALTEQYTSKPAPVPSGPAPRVTHTNGMIEVSMRGPHGATILVLRTLEHDMANLHRFGFQIAGMAVVTLVIGIVGGWWISGRMVQPIQMISETAAQISVERLDRRIETRHLDLELVQLASVLNSTFGRLEQSFGRLTQFTADASHELRTPLAVIQSQAELALSQPRSAESYQQTLATCLRSSERMRSLMDGLLLLARTDSDRLELRPEAIDLRHVAEDAVVQLQDKAQSAGVAIECITPDTAVMASADFRFLAQVSANLIDNAIQHTPAGGTICIEVRTERDEALLSVCDTGCGLAPEHIPHLFERFYRVDVGRSRQHGGSGLGLAICRSLVEAHGGSITCESTVGKGSTFLVRLPVLNGTSNTGLENVHVS